MNFFSRKRKEGQVKDLVRKFRTNINQLEKDYDNFNGQLHAVEENPIIPYLKLLGGIISLLISIVWVVQLLGTTVYINGRPAFRFLDSIFSDLNTGSAGFIASILYGVMVVYMLICLVKGNIIFGIKIPFILSVHPL